MANDASSNFRAEGNYRGDILVICDSPPPSLHNRRKVMGDNDMDYFLEEAKKIGLKYKDFYFVTPCPSIPPEAYDSDRRRKDFILQYHDMFHEALDSLPEYPITLCLGNTSLTQLTGKPHKITKERGYARKINGRLVLPMLTPSFVNRVAEKKVLFNADMKTLGRIKKNNYKTNYKTDIEEADYRWVDDLQPYIDEIRALNAESPLVMSFDTETTGLKWIKEEVYPFLTQISYKPNHALLIPVDLKYSGLSGRKFSKLISQLKELLEDDSIEKVGHNVNFDRAMLRKVGIIPKNVAHETSLLAFFADDNMTDKSLDECVRRWVPEMAGYADKFNRETDKSDMINVPKDKIGMYAGGDSDATLRLFYALIDIVMEDERNYNCYEKIHLPATLCFGSYLQPKGMPFSSAELKRFENFCIDKEVSDYNSLLSSFRSDAKNPRAILRKHLEKHKTKVTKEGERSVISFNRDELMRDILFTRDGFNLKPRVFTKTTKRLPPDQRIPSISTKDHMPYFSDDNQFIRDFIEYKKLLKIKSTYIKGFWEHIHDERIHPSFMLHRTTTGRVASADPNGQNFPKRGALAKAYRKVFKARKGYKLIEVDLSQAELRMVAWMANEPTMLAIYASGGDIHAETAAQVMGITTEQFYELDKETRDYKRYCAKAVNFGFIYGMSAAGFMVYAKTDYGIDYTMQEAEDIRNAFFAKYSRLQPWHKTMTTIVERHEHVRGMHGAIRRLPSIKAVNEFNEPDSGTRSLAVRQAINSPIQRIASDLGLIAMIRFCRDADANRYNCIGFIHDALIIEAREEDAEEAMSSIKWIMQNAPLSEWFTKKDGSPLECPIPILADCSIGDNLSQMTEREDIEAIMPDWFKPERDMQDQPLFLCN